MKNLASLRGYLWLLLSQLMVGVSIVTSKVLLTTMPPRLMLFSRFLIASVILLLLHIVFARKKGQPLGQVTSKEWLFIVVQALCAGALFNFLLLLGLKYTTASVAGIITSTLPAMITILSIVFLKEKLGLFTALCISFAVLGLIIMNMHHVVMGGAHPLLGGAIVLLALLPDALYYVISKVYKSRVPIFLLASLMNGINVPIFLGLLMFMPMAIHPHIVLAQGWLLLLLGSSSAFFYVFWLLGCQQVHGAVAGLSTAFMPIATVVIAWIFLDETLSWLQVIGMSLVMVSIVFHALRHEQSNVVAQ